MAAASATSKQKQWRPLGQSREATDPSVNHASTARVPRSSKDYRGNRNIAVAAAAASSSSSSSSSFPSTTSSADMHPPSLRSSPLQPIKGSCVPYLPQDDAVAAGLGADLGAIDAVETQHVADLLNEELGRLLKMQPLQFWQTVTMDSSIEVSLDSYLQFRRRWYDLHENENSKSLAGMIVGDQELFRRVFMVLYRMSLSLESGSLPTSDVLVPEKHTEKNMYQRRFFDVPKLFDICAIYGRDNANLTRQLVTNAFAINERLFDNLADIVPVLSKTIHTLQQRCLSTFTMQLAAINSESAAVSKIKQELLEVLDYLNDAAVSLQAFVDAFPEGALVLVLGGTQSDMENQILATLAAIHDFLIPTVRRSFFHLQGTCTDNIMESAAETRLKRLRFRLIELVWRLLCFSYLKESNFEDSQSRSVNYSHISNPRARGETFVQALSQTVEELFTLSSNEEAVNCGALIRNIDRKHKLFERVNQLCNKGLIFLDSVQYGYMEAICSHMMTAFSSPVPNHSATHPSNPEMLEVDVLNESKISHIKDILPDYGSGFIAACLEAYDNNPEEVIQRILEGTLHPSLLSLETTLECKPASQNVSVPVKDKGKGKVDEAPPEKKGNLTNIAETEVSFQKASSSGRWEDNASGLAQRLSSSLSASSSSASVDNNTAFPKSSDAEPAKDLRGRFVRKGKGEDANVLLDERYPDDILRTAAYAAQYEDEYDDSFDDLGAHVTDGVEETELLVDFARSKSLLGAEEGFQKINKRSSGSRIDGINNRGWTASNGVTYATSARENSSRPVEVQRKVQSQPTRGRGRGRRDEPRGQFFVKDGKNYSYRVSGSVAASSLEDAETLKRVEETIHGLREGGNVPVAIEQAADGRYSMQAVPHMNSKGDGPGRGGGAQGRGRGAPRKDYDHHQRKDRAMKKHFAGLGGM